MSSDIDMREAARQMLTESLRMLTYENQLQWARSNFFLVVNTVLLAAVLTRSPDSIGRSLAEAVVVLTLASIALTMVILWRSSVRVGNFWIFHWTNIARRAENQLYSEVENKLLSFEPDSTYPPRQRASALLAGVVAVFTFIWTGIAGIAMVQLVVLASAG